MIATIISLLLFSICNLTFGQVNQQDTVVLLKAFREFYKTGQIVYVDTVNNSGYVSEQLTTAIKKGKFTDIRKSGKDNSVTLTKAEQKYLLEQLAIKTIWDDNLFSDSKRIDSYSLWTYLKQENKKHIEQVNHAALSKDTLTYNKIKYKYPYVFSFTKPIYLRDTTICLIYFAAMCGNPCGRDEISLYKRENNEWTKWIVISSGDF